MRTRRARWGPVMIASVVGLGAAQAIADRPPAPRRGDRAIYRLVSVVERANPPVERVTLTVGPRERIGAKQYRWWDLHVQKSGERAFRVRILSEGVPMTSTQPWHGRIVRYIVREADGPALEYVDAQTGQALLPEFDFVDNFLPQPAAGAPRSGPFLVAGRYIGHALVLESIDRGTEWAELGPIKKLVLNPDLLVANSRSFRDTDNRRREDLAYTWKPLDRQDYEQMIRAGFNYFRIPGPEEKWMRTRPVFYEKSQLSKPASPYPEVFYRSNYRGAVMYMDEPAIRLGAHYDQIGRAPDPACLSNLLRLKALAVYESAGAYGSRRLQRELRRRGVNLGAMQLVERDIPIWETIYPSAFYQLEVCGSGIIHEGRYQLDAFNKQVARILGPGLRLDVEQMFLLHVAFLRGAARAFGKSWGISIYGQADPKISPKAITMAYDLGARYIWFWTSDGAHHVPFVEQLELARVLSEHARRHPRPPMEELLGRAEVAIVLPEGYMIQPHEMWHYPSFALRALNTEGIPYREVMAGALFEAVCCLKRVQAFDFVIASERIPPPEQRGYKRVIRIGRDGKPY